MKKITLIYGGIAGLITTVMLLFNTSSIVSLEYGEIFGYASMVIAFATIFVAVKKEKDSSQARMTFRKAFKIGIGITLIASLIYVFSWMIISETIAKDFVDNYYELSLAQMEASGELTAEEMEVEVAEMADFKELYQNPFFKIGITFLEIFPVGLVFSLLAALFLKTKGKE